MNTKMKISVLACCILLFFTCLAYAQGPNPYEGDWVADVADKVLPSVVNISSMKTVVVHQSPFFSDPLFREFFGGGIPRERVQRALGSGVIVSEDGYIVTNNHVVGGADKVEVRLSDERVFQARIIGTDPKSDVAIIKIEEQGLPAITIGDSSSLRIGSFVLAVGNPFGLEQTVTMGIVSALGRSGLGITDYENFIQTDAAINPGNSGGALVNMNGELIGINTAILSRTGGSVGIGFAIPINLVMSIKKSIELHGEVVRGWLGVSVQEITPKIAEALSLRSTKGVLISEVITDSPAEKGGIRQGDVLVSINGNAVHNTASMRFLISELMPGSSVEIEIVRDGSQKTMVVTIGDLSKAQTPEHKVVIKGDRFLEGATVADITPATRESLEIGNDVEGVLVIAVEDNTAAARTGLRPGDIIIQINNMKTPDLKEFSAVLKGLKGRKISLSIFRQGMIMTMTIIR
ncbi:MAG TPA: DegQ family serine endoprotease [Deltaproteobacteria bacterium]|nr:DegQ family serine endoprotease [Deltaproteobacteria bacterium]